MHSTVVSTLAFTATLASAHFQVLYPPQGIPFNDEEEATGPCGGPNPEITDSTADVQVDQFAVSIRSSHPESHWTFSATLDTEPPYNFTEISVVMTQGVGEFCLTHLSAPAEFAGSSGILQFVDESEHGSLYQCTPVNFVEGANATIGSACTNSSSDFTATVGTSDSMDSMDHDHGHGDMTSSMSMGASSTAAAESTSAEGAAAAIATGMGALAGLGMVMAGFAI